MIEEGREHGAPGGLQSTPMTPLSLVDACLRCQSDKKQEECIGKYLYLLLWSPPLCFFL